jgi:hypothetical protein
VTGIRVWPLLAKPPAFVQADVGSWRWLGRTDVRQIVVHTTECHEVAGAAIGVATFFKHPRPVVGASHLVVDSTAVVECVRSEHEAYGAKGGSTNLIAYHIEHCGYAAQTPVQWGDAYSRGELELSARAAACVARWYGIPATKLTPEQVAAGTSGFCSHLDVTRAWHVMGGHVDPGIGFPWTSYLERVRALLQGAP